MNRERSLLAALALLSASLTAQQVALMQVLGWMHWHHFAYMIVALALLGFGIAGTVLSVARVSLLSRWERLLLWLALTTALSIPLGVRLAQWDVLAVDLPLVFFDPTRHLWRLVVLCVLLVPPFFCGGLATGLLLTVQSQRAGRFYAASLTGSGAGGLAGLAFVANIPPPHLPTAVAVLALLAATCLLPSRSAIPPANSPIRGHLFAFAAVGMVLALGLWQPIELTPSQFKPIRRTLDLPDARIVASSPGVHGWTQVVAAPALRPAPAVGFNFIGEIPVQPAVFINGLGYGSLLDIDLARSPAWLDHTTDAAAFALTRPGARVALLENGSGGWAALAHQRGAATVFVVEPNRALVHLLTAGPAPLAAEWALPGTELVSTSGRRFLWQSTDSPDRTTPLDVIRFPSVGALGGSAGLAATNEQFLLTRESFLKAWQRLTPGGVIAVTAWMDFPERNPLRLLATLVETAQEARIAPRNHLVALRGWATVTFLLRREPWPPAALETLRSFCDERGFDPLLLPDLGADERERNHVWQNPEFFTLVDRIAEGEGESLYEEYPFELRPTRDSKPYFSQFFRWRHSGQLTAVFGAQAVPLFELGSLSVALTFGVLATLGLIGIVLPLVRTGRRSATGDTPNTRVPRRTSTLFYFSGLGAGFMLIEIGLMLRAHGWLGSAVVASAFVLTVLLLASGAGSLWSERLPADPSRQRWITLLIAGGAVVTLVLLRAAEPLARAWPLAAQCGALLRLVGPLGFAMGCAFPVGLRSLASAAPSQVPWAWAINGCVSVATPAAAVLLAMSAGFDAVLVGAAIAYAVAGAATLLSSRRGRRPGGPA